MIKASIDIGSNSILLLVAEVESNKIIKVLENHSNVTGLGRDLDKENIFIQEAMDDSKEVILKYVEILKKYNVRLSDVIVTATEASRVSKNSSSFFKTLSEETGLTFTIITGEAEAYFSTKGILIGSDVNDMVIMDIGGASTELIQLKDGELVSSFSMPMGAVRINNWLENSTLEEKLENIKLNFKDQLERLVPTKYLHCVAGTMTSVANMDLGNESFEENQVHGHKISYERIAELLQQYQKMSSHELLSKFPFLGKRSQTIVAGLILANEIIKQLHVKMIEVSTYGLRYGTLIEGVIKDEFIFKQ